MLNPVSLALDFVAIRVGEREKERDWGE